VIDGQGGRALMVVRGCHFVERVVSVKVGYLCGVVGRVGEEKGDVGLCSARSICGCSRSLGG
jgi:hypothetical protein